MTKRRILLLFPFLFFLSRCFGEDSFDEFSRTVLEEEWRFHPVSATFLGIHSYDSLLGDYSQSALEKRCDRIRSFIAQMEGIDTTAFSTDDRIDYTLLKISLSQQLFFIEEIQSYRSDPVRYVDECISGIYYIILRSPPEFSRARAIRGRLRSIPPFLENAKKNLVSPPEIFCSIAIEKLSEGERLIEDIVGLYIDSIPEDKRDDFELSKVRAIASMRVFSDWLLDNGEKDVSYTLGRENYEYMLANIHLLGFDSDSMLRIGENMLEFSGRMIDSLQDFYGEPERESIVLPSGFGKEDVIEYRKDEIGFLRDFVASSEIVTVPDDIGELVVVETPGFLRTVIPGIAMMPPGPYDDLDTSYFYMRPLSEKFSKQQREYYHNYIHNRWFRGSVVHEGYPGHHLQISIANNHPSLIRKSWYDYFFIEGWALYCEEFMAHTDLFSDDTLGAIINSLYGVRFRAARVIVDVKLNTKEFTYEDAVTFMRETLGGDSTFYAREVRRYITDPGQASSYLIGKIQILNLLEDYKDVKGEYFDLKTFHDELLSHGSIPVALLRRALGIDER
jgi:hypothetical protein